MVVNYLEAHQMRALSAPGREAMMSHLAQSEPDLAILELRLGQDNGLDLLRDIRSRADVPVIILADERLPVRITRPSCYADDERSAEHRTPAGAGELGGRAKEPVSVKGELRGIERGPQKVVSLWVRIHGAALLKPEFSPDAEGARPQRCAQDVSLWSSKPLFRSHRNG